MLLARRHTGKCVAARLIGMLALSAVGIEANAADVDSAIVFAVDVSLSVDPFTADLQREGHVEAIRSHEIVAAISRNPLGCTAIAYIEWSSPGRTRTVLPWTTLCGPDDAEAAAWREQPLTEWLHNLIARMSGVEILTFGHLWIYSNEVDVARSPLKQFAAGPQALVQTN
jgi:hypothetical protein